MSLDNNYLNYPHRSYGMDHDSYRWQQLHERPQFLWPGDKALALCINISVEHFPLDQSGIPFKVPGGMTKPYPDLRHYSLRDYGNRVGIYRVLEAMENQDIKPSLAINSALVDKYPYLVHKLKELDSEIIAHGWHMDTIHHSGMTIDAETEIVKRSIDSLSDFFEKKITGWLSPAKYESWNTPRILADAGIEYFMDWNNDELPYAFNTVSGSLIAAPMSTDLEDHTIIIKNCLAEHTWQDQICDAMDMLLEESIAENSGRLLSINIHPWIIGHAHRIKFLENILTYIKDSSEKIWITDLGKLVQFWKSQVPQKV